MSFIAELNDRYFDGELSASVVALLAPIDDEHQEAKDFAERMCRQLSHQRVGAKDLSDLLALVVGSFIPKMLPGAWGGAIPPITQPGRHAAIDEYLARNPWRPLGDGDRLLDLGCGFPPTTTLDTAARFPGVDITGADPSFGKFLVRDANEDYAVFSAADELLYFQAGEANFDRWTALYDDPVATRERFRAHLENLRPSLPEDDGRIATVAGDGYDLVANPVAEFEKANVRFVQKGIGSDGVSGFQSARCFNVLMYFDDAFRQEALAWFPGAVDEGGLVISGCNWRQSRYSRYSVHQCVNGEMKAREFAFSIENVRPLEAIAVFTLHEDDHDLNLMASLIRILRGDEAFRSDFDRRLDAILAELEFCARKADGYLGALPEGSDPMLMATAGETIGSALEQEGFADRAVGVLEKTGFHAWVNCVGHIAVEPKGP